jgi:hypothetical protein
MVARFEKAVSGAEKLRNLVTEDHRLVDHQAHFPVDPLLAPRLTGYY